MRPDPTNRNALTSTRLSHNKATAGENARCIQCLEVMSVNPWYDRPRYFPFKLGMKHLLHISYKTRMLNGIIFITTFQMRWNEIFELLQNNSIQRIKTYILLQKLDILKQYAIMRQNGAGSDKQKRFDVDQIVA